MSNLTVARDTPNKQTTLIYSFPVLHGVVLPALTMAFLSSGRYAAPGAASTAQIGLGRVKHTVDNTASSSDGLDVNGLAIKAEIEPGIFRWVNGDSIGQGDVGKRAYSDDNQTAYKGSASKSFIGVIIEVTADGVWVYSAPELAMLAVAAAADAAAAQTTANAAVPLATVQYAHGLVMVAGTIACTTLNVTASSIIVPLREVPDVTAAHWGALTITSPVVGAPGSFNIHSASATDVSTVGAIVIG